MDASVGDVPAEGPAPSASDVGASPEATSLVSAELWRAVPPERDPFLSWAEAEIDCSPVAGYFPEQGALEVDTGRCNFVTLEQPLPVALPAGAVLEVEIVHFDLIAATPAEGRAAIAFSDGTGAAGAPNLQPSWERSIAIPAPANRIVERFEIATTLARGAHVLFHLQNHGQNTWMLVRIDWLAPQ